MSQVSTPSAGGLPATAGGAGGSHRGLRQIGGDFAHHPLAMAGLIVLALALVDTLVAPLFINASTSIGADPFQGPNGSHLLGTDEIGRDELARLLYGIHLSMLLVGATLALAVVVAAVALAVVRLLGRNRGQEWARWAEVMLTPAVGVLLLGGASLVVGDQFGNLPNGSSLPNLFNWVFTLAWTDVFQRPLSIGTQIQQGNVASLLILIVLVGELVRFVYLLVQRLRSARAPQPHSDSAAVTPVWVRVAIPAIAIGLWVAADALLLEDLLEGYIGNSSPPNPVTPSLGLMFGEGGSFISQVPWLALLPFAAILVLYASLNLVGFRLCRVLLRAPEPEQP